MRSGVISQEHIDGTGDVAGDFPGGEMRGDLEDQRFQQAGMGEFEKLRRRHLRIVDDEDARRVNVLRFWNASRDAEDFSA